MLALFCLSSLFTIFWLIFFISLFDLISLLNNPYLFFFYASYRLAFISETSFMFLPFLPVLPGQVSPAPIIWPSHLHSWIYALKFSSEFQTLLSHLIQVGTLEYNFHLLFHNGKLCCSLSFYCFSLGYLSKDLVVWCFLFIFKLVEFLWTRKQKVPMEGFLLNDSLLFCYWTETASLKYGVFSKPCLLWLYGPHLV